MQSQAKHQNASVARRRVMTCAAAGTALLAVTVQVHAADLGGREPPPPQVDFRPSAPAPIWTGFYLGASIGYGWGDSEQAFEGAGSSSLSPEGFAGSLTAGYNFQIAPSFVVGIEGDLGVMDLTDDGAAPGGRVYESTIGPLWGTLRGRAGFLAGPSTLIYATGGLAFADFDEVTFGPLVGDAAFNDDFKTGWTVGGGFEFALTDSMTLKGEYLHMDFGSTDGTTANGDAFSFDNTVDMVRAGVNIRF